MNPSYSMQKETVVPIKKIRRSLSYWEVLNHGIED